MTPLISFLTTSTSYLQRKIFFFKEVFSFALFSLFFGFLVGNSFGTFLNTIRSFIFWDGFIIFLILFSMELLDFVLYTSFFGKQPFVPSFLYKKSFVILFLNWKIINILKIGILFGFFIDAFKVGS